MLSIVFIACSGGSKKPANMSEEAYKQYQEVLTLVQELENNLDDIRNVSNPAELRKVSMTAKSLKFDYDPMGMGVEEQAACAQLKERLASLRAKVDEIVEETVRDKQLVVLQKTDYLMESMEAFPIYLERGDKVYYRLQAQRATSVKIYNANSHQLLKTYTKSSLYDSLQINNTAVYLVEIDSKGTEYVDIELSYKAHSAERFMNPKTVKSEMVEGRKGDFRATSVSGVNMKNLFEDPRKFTLRGQLKAAFSGSYRAIVALQVPAGATDVLYSLRISTNEGDHYSDGKFKDNMDASYKRVKFLGLPLYETHSGSGLLNTLLGENQPPREEDAYINMYVFYNAAQAKKFQDGGDPAKLQYNLDYSTMGTQSCTGRIPSKGNKTIYLGFLNERMRYNNYVWLEAVSAVPTKEYFVTKYTVE